MVIAEHSRRAGAKGVMNARKERGIWSLREREKKSQRQERSEAKGSAERGREGGREAGRREEASALASESTSPGGGPATREMYPSR